MKTKSKTSVPNVVVYAVLYVLVFGICIWTLITDPESPTNWLAYAAMVVSLLAGAIKLALYFRTQQRTA